MRILKRLTRFLSRTPAPSAARSLDGLLIGLVTSQHDLPFYLHPPVSRR
jgi:hypothetical protein